MCPYFAFAELQVWAIVLIGIFTVIGFILLLLLCFLVSGPFTVPPLGSSGAQTPGRLQEGHPDTATRSPMGAAPDSKRDPKSCITANSFKDSCTERGRVFTGSSVGRSGSWMRDLCKGESVKPKVEQTPRRQAGWVRGCPAAFLKLLPHSNTCRMARLWIRECAEYDVFNNLQESHPEFLIQCSSHTDHSSPAGLCSSRSPSPRGELVSLLCWSLGTIWRSKQHFNSTAEVALFALHQPGDNSTENADCCPWRFKSKHHGQRDLEEEQP